uniref:NADH-ubiquinone oxidoreductase chain 4L n=1 Tax=Selaginella moellendorffii TaxID=88036 RepID=F2YI93_SELML|nr:NADH dehydrogenase subunit 4L [Selaginella moellendorffii]AEA29872.1 NADH dehydrogenase subunit 4L [Selaginella moellendorffii]
MTAVNYLTFSTILFLLAIGGVLLNSQNLFILLMSIELMLLAVNMNFLVFSVLLDDMMGQLLALFILAVAAADSAMGLAILVTTYRTRGTMAVEYATGMKG